MRTPVIIAAHKEAAYIGHTLERLDASTTEPLVMVNGSDDGTANVARGFGVQTWELKEAGKLPAIQEGLKKLGDRALGPVLYLDADSVPVFPRKWSTAMSRHLSEERPSCVSGVTILGDAPFIEACLRSTKRCARIVRAHRAGNSTAAVFGANMGTCFQSASLLEEVIEMDHIWPGEDRAMVDKIRKTEESAFHQSVDPRTAVKMSSRSLPPLKRKFALGGNDKLASLEAYLNRAPAGVAACYLEGETVPIEEAWQRLIDYRSSNS